MHSGLGSAVGADLFAHEPPAKPMRAISLWQPWATAIALGHKAVETRGWTTRVRGEIAIHAAKRWTPEQRNFAAVERACGRLNVSRLPFGAVVALAEIVEVRETEEAKLLVGPMERIWGDYGSGRFAWFLADVRPLAEPVGCKGGQGFFFLPPDVEAAVRAQVSA